MITALYADAKGEIFDAPGIAAAGRLWDANRRPARQEWIPMPEGAELMFLPGRTAVGCRRGKLIALSGRYAVAAMLPVGYTRTLLPGYVREDNAPVLPLFGYTAVGAEGDRFYVAAVNSDDNAKWHPYRYNTPGLKAKVDNVKRLFPGNRLAEHLGHCSLTWHCCTAQNLFYHRWEAGIPASPVCNANCLGCISLQPAECCPSPQNRIAFRPTAEEIGELMLYHLTDAPEPIISFGQGCEGEPSLAAPVLADAIRKVRARTDAGVININTNAGYTEGIRLLVDAGLDSMRVSMISARPETYQAYYRAGYGFDQVAESVAYAKANGVYVSINMLLFPGLNDRDDEMAAWFDFINRTGVDLIQLRNLNLDPDAAVAALPAPSQPAGGIRTFLSRLATACPHAVTGSFSHYLE